MVPHQGEAELRIGHAGGPPEAPPRPRVAHCQALAPAVPATCGPRPPHDVALTSYAFRKEKSREWVCCFLNLTLEDSFVSKQASAAGRKNLHRPPACKAVREKGAGVLSPQQGGAPPSPSQVTPSTSLSWWPRRQ